jgi:hypothetical protein
MSANFEHLHVRVNVTWPSTILELSETSAVVRVPRTPTTDRQTTVVIKNDNGESLYLPGRIVRSRPEEPGGSRQEHHIVVEFFELSAAAKASLQHIIAGSAESDTRSHPAA